MLTICQTTLQSKLETVMGLFVRQWSMPHLYRTDQLYILLILHLNLYVMTPRCICVEQEEGSLDHFIHSSSQYYHTEEKKNLLSQIVTITCILIVSLKTGVQYQLIMAVPVQTLTVETLTNAFTVPLGLKGYRISQVDRHSLRLTGLYGIKWKSDPKQKRHRVKAEMPGFIMLLLICNCQ